MPASIDQEKSPLVLMFDAGQVLVKFDDDAWAAKMKDLCDPKVYEAKGMASFLKATAIQTRPCTIEEVYPAAETHLGFRHGPARLKEAWNDTFQRMPEMEDLTDQLKFRHRMVVVSNTNLPHWDFLKEGGYLGTDRFAREYTSHDLGFKKPDPRYYQRVLAEEGLTQTPERAVFIDDRPDNVAAAKAVGMQAILFTDRATLEKDLAKLGVVSFPLAPMFDQNGAPKRDAAGKPLVLPFDHASVHNAKAFIDAGTVPVLGPSGKPLTAAEQAAFIAEQKVVDLIGTHPAQDLYFFNPREVIIVSKEGDILYAQRSQRGASKGDCQHTAGGFPSVFGGADETPAVTAHRELKEELKLEIDGKLVDLDMRTHGAKPSTFVLPDTAGGSRPGSTVEILKSFAIFSDRPTNRLLAAMHPNCESVGMTVMTANDLEKLARGETALVRYVPTTAPFAQPVLETAMAAAAPVSMAAIREALRQAPPLTPDERRQRGEFPPETMIQAVASTDVFTPRAIAVGLAAADMAGISISPEARAFVEAVRKAGQQPPGAAVQQIGQAPKRAGKPQP